MCLFSPKQKQETATRRDLMNTEMLHYNTYYVYFTNVAGN